MIKCSIWVRLATASLAIAAAGGLMHTIPATAGDGETVSVEMTTTYGTMTIEVYPQHAPLTAANFLAYVDGGHYNGGAFYRTVTFDNDNHDHPIQVIQGGINVIGQGGESGTAPLPPIPHESTRDSRLRHSHGTLSMARFDPGSAASEFFICIGDNPVLDYGGARHGDGQGFAVFARVVRGLDVIDQIHQGPADGPTDIAYIKGQILTEPVGIIAVKRLP